MGQQWKGLGFNLREGAKDVGTLRPGVTSLRMDLLTIGPWGLL